MQGGRQATGQGRGLVVGYAAAHAGKTLFWTASDIYFGFYLTEVCGIAASVMGLVLAGSYLVNAGSDWMLGRRLARSVRTAHGAGTLQVWGAALCSATLLLFGCVALVAPGARIVTCIAALLVFRIAYSLYDIPQNSLLALAGVDDRGRARLTAARILSGGLARIALSAAFVPLFVRQSTTAQIHAFLMLTGLMAVTGLASAALLSRCLGHDAASAGRDSVDPVLARPPGIGAWHAMMLILSAGTTVFTQLEPYLAAFAIQSRLQAGAMLTAVAVGTALSQPVWTALDHRQPPLHVAIAALGVAGIGALLFPLLVLQGVIAAVLAGALYGTGVGGLFFLLWTGIARQAARRHGRFGATATLGAFSGSAKLGQAAAILAVGLYLQHARAPADLLLAPSLLALMAGSVLVALALLALIGWRMWRTLAPARPHNVRSVS